MLCAVLVLVGTLLLSWQYNGVCTMLRRHPSAASIKEEGVPGLADASGKL